MKKRRISLFHKALLAVMLMLFPIFTAFFYTYNQNKKMLEEEALKSLAIIAEASKAQIYQLIEMENRRTQDFSSDGFIKESLRRIIRGKSGTSGLNSHLIKNKLPLDTDIYQILILSMKGRVVASTSGSAVGRDFSKEIFFTGEKPGWNVIEESPAVAQSPTLAVSSLIADKNTRKPIGVLVNLVSISAFDRALSKSLTEEFGALSSGIKSRYRTTEIYLVDRNGLMLTDSLFVKDAILKQRVDTPPVRKCIDENREYKGFYKDYTGAKVAGISMCLPKLKWTLVTEIDSSEILAPARVMRTNAVITIVALAILVSALLIFFHRNVVLPLRRMSKGIEAVANGKYDISLPVETMDEIGILSNSFNLMSSQIQERADIIIENEMKFRTVVDNSTAVIYMKDIHGRYIMVNLRWWTLFGLKKEQVIGKTAYDVFPKETADILTRNDMEVLKSGDSIQFDETIPQSGGVHHYISVKFPLFDKNGAVYAICGISTDITERKRADDARFEAQQKYEDLVNNLPVGVYRHKITGELVEANPAALSALDLDSKEDFANHNVAEFYKDKENFKETSDKLARHGFVKNEEFEFVSAKGRPFWCSFSAVLKKNTEHGDVYIDGMIEDITEKKALEDQLRHSQKMEAIGRLAGGIAHDFNNILTSIIGYGNLLLKKRHDDEITKDYVGEMLGAANRAATLTKDLLSFSRKHVIATQPFDLNELVKKNLNILARVIGEHIEFKADIADKKLVVKMDTSHIEQALLNLAANARDAMQNGGQLSITTATVTIDNDFIIAHGYGKAGNYALLTFADTGVGIAKEIQSRLFEPFFTTKEVGKGTGLGLSIVYGIVKQHNGFINVYSEPGCGAVFKIYLPLAGDAAPVEEKPLPDIILPKGNMETILLAEDDPEIRKIAKEVLEEYNYKVIEAENGEDAVNKFRANRDEIQITILDVIMPKKGGVDACRDIREISPDAKCFFMSGYTGDMIKTEDINREGFKLISKPVSPNELLTSIKEMLGK